ncbi:DMT family transporter [Ktedonospora formicarum]|uniref:Membrane protein n=1 Tax=Ktedonospora formicarum TaxID=2778364 RepID=A0A8J3HZV2_9CHLR|nr:DMT family transporter [Ktedonospora formicarum]GHO42309.1 membrane protein [Ktedonospora formicarum]
MSTLAAASEEMGNVQKQNRLRDLGALAVLILLTVIWGGSVLPLDYAIMHIGVFSFQVIRFSLAALALGLLYHRRLKHLTRQVVVIGVLTSCVLFCFYATQTVALNYTTVSMVGFLNGLYVPIVPLFSIVFLRQWPTVGVWIGILLSFCGLLLLSLNDHFVFTIGPGEVLLLISAVAYSLYIVLISKFAPHVDAIALSWVQMVCLALLSLITLPIAHEPLTMPSGPVWLAAIFMALVPTAFCMAMMNRIQQFVSSVQATLCYALEPVWGAIFGYFVGDRLGAQAWIGCVCILLAMVIGSLSVLKKKA